MSRTEEIFMPALAGAKLPILTLDNKWHKLFDQLGTDKRVKKLEDKLNDLLKKQGKANTEIKEIKRLKKKLMQDIMENAQESSAGNGGKAQKKANDDSRLINECNAKIRGYEDDLGRLPDQIEKVNRELMLATMEICYSRMKENERDSEDAAKWIAQMRIELKKRLVRKQEVELMNQELYSYMHDIFGASVINMFDVKYRVNVSKDAAGSDGGL